MAFVVLEELMVRIYGSGVPGGDIAIDGFSTGMSKARDAAAEAAAEAAKGKSRTSAGEAKAGAAHAGAVGVGAVGATGAAGAGAGAVGILRAEADVAVQIEDFRARAMAKFAGSVSGDPFACVVAVKTKSAASTQGADEALRKSLESLGYDAKSLLDVLVPAAGSTAGSAEGGVNARSLRQIVELVDPVAVIALDANASQMLADAFANAHVHHELPPANRTPAPPQNRNSAAAVNGRTHVFLHDFEGSLSNIDAKRHAWAALRTLRRT